MVKVENPILNLSDAMALGLIPGRSDAAMHVVLGKENPVNSQYIHYVGSKEWKKQPAGVVLLHGGSGDWRHFGANLADLARVSAVVAVDLPGFGGSDAPIAADLAGVVAPVAAFIRALPWRDVTLVGFSFGALIASAVALDAPPARLMLVSPAGFGAHVPEMATAREQAARATRAHGVRAGLEMNLRNVMLHDPEAVDREPALQAMEEMLRAARLKARGISRSELILDKLRYVSCPVSVLLGASDPFHASVMVQRRAEIAAACPQARVMIVESAAHWLMLERPEIFAAALHDFCERDVRDDRL